MAKKYIFLLLVIMIIGLGVSVYADDISLSATIDRDTIDINDQVILTVQVEGGSGNIPEPVIPPNDAFTAYSSGHSRNISIINGRVSSATSFTYVLVPNTTGQFTLGPVSLRYQGKLYQATPLAVTVIRRNAASVTPQAQQSAPYTSAPGTRRQSASQLQGKDIFIKTSVDKSRAYVNEQITLTFAFYQAVQLFDNPVYNPPSTRGFWSEDMPPQNKYYKNLNGARYLVTEIKTALFPTQPGEFIIGSAHLEVNPQTEQSFFGRDLFSVFQRGKPIGLTSDPIAIKVMPLPQATKPVTFTGDVGSFTIKARVDKVKTTVGEPITLTVSITGQGNIKTITEPNLSHVEYFKIYDSASSEEVTKNNYVVGGTKQFEKVLIPTKSGKLTIPAINYTFFDTTTKTYTMAATRSFTIDVSPSDNEQETVIAYGGPEKQDIKLIGHDIHYIHTDPKALAETKTMLYKQPWLRFIVLLLPFLYGVLIVQSNHQRRLSEDVGYARGRRARKVAHARCSRAEDLMRQGNYEAVYQELHRAIAEYCGDKLNIPSGGLTTDDMISRVKRLGFAVETVTALEALLGECDQARFAPGEQDVASLKEKIKRAEEILMTLERSSLWTA